MRNTCKKFRNQNLNLLQDTCEAMFQMIKSEDGAIISEIDSLFSNAESMLDGLNSEIENLTQDLEDKIRSERAWYAEAQAGKRETRAMEAGKNELKEIFYAVLKIDHPEPQQEKED